MENGIVQALLLLALLVFAVLFFTAARGRDRTRDKLLHRPARRSSRSHTHRHP